MAVDRKASRGYISVMSNVWLFALFLAFSGLIYLQFIRGRRKNLDLIKRCSATMENVFRPADRTYTWIGGVAGFKAKYEFQDGVKLFATFVLLPRQSLLYFPFSKLIFRADRLYLTLELPHTNRLKRFPSKAWGEEETGLKFLKKLEVDPSGRRLKALIWYDADSIENVFIWLKDRISKAV